MEQKQERGSVPCALFYLGIIGRTAQKTKGRASSWRPCLRGLGVGGWLQPQHNIRDGRGNRIMRGPRNKWERAVDPVNLIPPLLPRRPSAFPFLQPRFLCRLLSFSLSSRFLRFLVILVPLVSRVKSRERRETTEGRRLTRRAARQRRRWLDFIANKKIIFEIGYVIVQGASRGSHYWALLSLFCGLFNDRFEEVVLPSAGKR